MKKRGFPSFVAAMLAALTLVACGAKEDGYADTDTEQALDAIVTAAREALPGVQLPMTIQVQITENDCENRLGITPAQFGADVEEAYMALAAIGTHAFEVVLIKTKGNESASTLKKAIADGYDSRKWICVLPEQSFVVDSGRFVLLGSVPNDTAEAFQTAFDDYFENNTLGTVNTFYERGDEAPADGGDGGFGGGDLIIVG